MHSALNTALIVVFVGGGDDDDDDDDEILASYHIRNQGRRNTMMTSDFTPEVEIWPFRACAIKNMHYNPYLWTNRPDSVVL